ncbi:MAG: PelD GGDEF domain-containing protein, partial [Granulosicoccus sp.]|nr:PelD GGDEF domain-containing protein [Granulosicoccus sp.]
MDKRQLLKARQTKGPANPSVHTSKLKKINWQILQRSIELCLFALLIPVAGLVFFPHNPTGLGSGFPWVVAAPVIFTARYGSAWGVSCAAVTAVFINLPFEPYAESSSIHLVMGIAMIALCLIVGDMVSANVKRYLVAESEASYLRHRIKLFSTDYHVLKVSHGLLESYIAGQRLSLREALQNLKPLLQHGDVAAAAEKLLALFSRFCSVHVAALYRLNENGRIEAKSLASCGAMPELSVFDPVLKKALSEKELVSVEQQAIRDTHQRNCLIAAVPLLDNNDRIHAVLAIQDMHFMAFQQKNLNLMALLGRCVGNLLLKSTTNDLSPAEKFLSELKTSIQFARSHQTQSVMLSLQFEPSEQGLEIAQFVCNGVRSLDASWLCNDHLESPVVCLLFPLMSVDAGEAFLQRLDVAIKESFDLPLSHILQDSQIRALTARDNIETCKFFYSIHVGPDAFDAA